MTARLTSALFVAAGFAFGVAAAALAEEQEPEPPDVPAADGHYTGKQVHRLKPLHVTVDGRSHKLGDYEAAGAHAVTVNLECRGLRIAADFEVLGMAEPAEPADR